MFGENTKLDLTNYIKDGRLTVRVKPSSPKNKILHYDTNIGALRVEIKAAPESGKANMEVIKFFSKLLKKKVEIVKGKTSKNKVLKIHS